jgi:hypothetical protein
MPKLSTITPATDWYFVHEGHNDVPVVWPIAAWGILLDTHEVVGLIGAFGREQGEQGKSPRLDVVPPVPGRYLHVSQLTQQEREQAKLRTTKKAA